MKVELRTFEVRLARPLLTARGAISSRRCVGLRVSDRSTSGFGEASPLPGWTEPYGRCLRTLAALETDRILTHPLPVHRPAARHALQLATIDLAARRVDTTLARYLRPDAARTIPLNATIGARTEQDAVEAAICAVDRGFPAIKCKVGADSIATDIARIRAIRNAVGDDVELRIDANRSWTPSEAGTALGRLVTYDVAYVEEPVQSPDPSVLASLAEQGVPIAADETVNTGEFSIRELAAGIDVVVIKPMSIGGLDRALAAVRTARSFGIVPVISGTIDSVVGRTAAVHLAAVATPNTPAGLATAQWIDSEPGREPITIEDGHALLPSASGLGTQGPWDEPEVPR